MARLIASLAALFVLAGCSGTSFVITPIPSTPELEEKEVRRESIWARQKIALIDVSGILRNSREESLLGFASGEHPVSAFKEKLDAAADDPAVKAIVVRINSPGGSVTASELMYEELRAFRERSGKPVIAQMMDVAASGGYYLACAADEIHALPTTVTGSIGVIMILPELTGTMRKLGVSVNTIKSGTHKDSGSPFREMTTDDREIFEGIIQAMYGRFVDVVARARSTLPRDRVLELADGRVYYAPQALEAGLIDRIGSLDDAIDAARAAADIGDRPIVVVQYGRVYAYRPNIYAQAGAGGPVNLVNVELPEWLSRPSPQFMYLWAPSW